jgi:hypothetical protein
MIEIDPRLYLPADYMVHWKCPACGRSAKIELAQLDTAACSACAHDPGGAGEPPPGELPREVA